MPAELHARLQHAFGRRVRFDVPLGRYTSFRIGGPADALVAPNSLEELQGLMRIVADCGAPCTLLGRGTNVLISDRGVRGVVVRLGRGFDYAEWPAPPAAGAGCCAHVRVGAGRALGRFVREAAQQGYGGVEFAEGIPGTVGGGLLMNAGAYGGELSDVVTSLTGVTRTGKVLCLPGPSVGFGYRRTALPARFIVGEVAFRLPQKSPAGIGHALRHARQRRRGSQPRGFPNAGSIFKNPPAGAAGRLIEEVGGKGLREGAAEVSPKHANFIVNTGGATAGQVWELVERVQRRVWQRRQVWLEPEIERVGEW